MPLTYYETTIAQNDVPNSLGPTFSYGFPAIPGNLASGTTALFTGGVVHLMPFFVQSRVVAQQLWWINGTGPMAGSIHMGIYDDTYTRLVTSGAVAVSGTNVVQSADIADTTLERGTYYLAWMIYLGAGTNRHGAVTVSPTLWARAYGCVQVTGQTSLPASFVRSGNAYNQGNMPICGLAYRSFV